MWGKSATNQSEGEGRERGCCLLQVYPCPVPILHLSTQPQHPAAIVGFLISFPRGCGVAGRIQVPRSQPRARRYRYELLLRTEMVRAPCVPRARRYVHLALIGQVAVVPSLGAAPYPSFLSGFSGWELNLEGLTRIIAQNCAITVNLLETRISNLATPLRSSSNTVLC